MVRALRVLTFLAAIAAATACQVKDTKAPPLSGPSELGLSLTLQASPDVLTQDGASQATLVVLARDASGQPVRNVTLRVDISVDGRVVDFGTLSSRTLVTGGDGRASTIYTAPPAPLAITANESVVTFVVTPVGTDYANAEARLASIRLVPGGVIIPPSAAVPGFSFTPDKPLENEAVGFDGSACQTDTAVNCSRGVIVLWAWDFGDGGTATGPTATHRYAAAGSYAVTLSATDGQGRVASTTRYVGVQQAAAPTAAFEFSPTDPTLGVLGDGTTGAVVRVNATASKAAAGRQIVSYAWDFGDGKQKTGVLQDHTYRTANAFVIVLTVTDDLGRSATVSKTVTVK